MSHPQRTGRFQHSYGELGLWTAMLELLERHGFTRAEISRIRVILGSRWSVAGDLKGTGEQLRRTLKEFSGDPRVAAVAGDVDDAAWNTDTGRAKHRIVPITFADIYDTSDVLENSQPPGRGTVIGYLLFRDDLAVLRIGWSASLSGAIYNRRGEATNLFTELLCQMMKVVRFCQLDGSGESWAGRPLDLKFSEDFTRSGRFALEHARMRQWLNTLNVDFWLGNDRQDRSQFAEMIASIRAQDAENKGSDATGRTTKGIIDHLTVPDREPRTENHTLPWRRHKRDPEQDHGRAKVKDGNGHSIIGEWDVAAVPAVRAWIRTYAGHLHYSRSLHDDLALVLVAHEALTTPPGKTNGLRSWTYLELLHPTGSKADREVNGVAWGEVPFEQRWDTCARRAANWLLKNNQTKLEPLPPEDNVARGRTERRNAERISYLEAARTGKEVVRFSLPESAEAHLEVYGASQLRVVRDFPTDKGYVVIQRWQGFPPQHTLRTETREILVPGNAFKGRAVRRDAATAAMSVEVERLDAPVLDEHGQPVPWTRLGLDDELFDTIYTVKMTKKSDGQQPIGDDTVGRVLPTSFPLYDAVIDGEPFQFLISSEGTTQAPTRAIYRRPLPRATTSEGACVPFPKLRKVPKTEITDEATGETLTRVLLDGEDVTDWRLGIVQERLLLRGAAHQLEAGLKTALGGEVVLRLPVAAQDDERAVEIRRERLMAQALDAIASAEQCEQDATGQDLLSGRRLNDGDEAGVQRCENLAKTLRAEAAELRREAARLQQTASGLHAEAVEDRAELDLRRAAALIKLLERLADQAGTAQGELLARLRVVLGERFDSWRIVPASDGGWDISCVAHIDTIDGQYLELPLAWWAPNTADGIDGKHAEDTAMMRNVLRGEQTIDEAVATATRTTSRRRVVKRLRKELADFGVATRMTTALLDHPFNVARQAAWVLGGGTPPAEIEWGPATVEGAPSYLELMHETLFTEGQITSRAACPTDVTCVQIIAACLAKHPNDGVEIAELVARTTIPADEIRQMVSGRPRTKQFAGRPAYFRWLDTGVSVGLHPCKNPACPSPGSVASAICLLPETNRRPGQPGGALCPKCFCLVGYPGSPFPRVYVETLVTGRKGGGTSGQPGSVETKQVTIPTVLPDPITTVSPAAWVTTARLCRETGLSRPIIEACLEAAGVARQLRKAGGQDTKPKQLWDATPARTLLVTGVAPPRVCRASSCDAPPRPKQQGLTGRHPSYCEHHAA